MNTLQDFRLHVAKLLVATCLLCTATAFGGDYEEHSRSFVLIRSTGGSETVQECQVTRENGGYSLTLKENARVWLPQERVLCIAKSMLEVYEFRKKRIPTWNSGDHLQMGRWCLRYGLIDEASDHYLAIPAHFRSHSSVAQFGQAIKSRMLADAQFREYLGIAPLLAPQVAEKADKPKTPKSDGPVVTASSEDSTLNVSPEAKARFYSRVQPILKNRCSQAACHGFRGKSDFRLYEPYGQAFNRISEANLLATAEHASSKPGSSTPTLIEYATSAHGVQRSPGVAPNETQLINELTIWCRQMASPVVSADARSIHTNNNAVAIAVGTESPRSAPSTQQPSALQPVGPGKSALRTVPQDPSSLLESGAQEAGASEAETLESQLPANRSGFPKGTQAPKMSEIDKLDQELKRILGETKKTPSEASQSEDPFDASAFNNLPR